ncbi:protein SCO1/2 [Pseudomonas abietaniphila]|uniref:Protein SCO1/2 n=2 Tax=Pseudomonas abietaniphila TaxID=89065 RepID=A0A1G8LX64_9PSED|nr:protein SCO1/2 [Pseudomonas abietaniphila]
MFQMLRSAAIAVTVFMTVMVWGSLTGVAGETPSATPWGQDFFPNTVLINQDEQPVHFYDDLIKGKVVVINFIFTSCTDSCPLETARLRQVQRLLGDRVGKDVFFYSISIDPETDTPAVLKQYAAKFKVAPGWQFLTGNKDDIVELRRKLGLFIEGVDNGRTTDHNLSLIVGNQTTGRWMKASPFENPYILADHLGNSLQNWKVASEHLDSYANAPDVRAPSLGEQIFRTRCSACHTLGHEGEEATGLRGVGPDLLGVTRQRDGLWLGRWLKEPDVMLAEKDPLAMSLYEAYNKVAMPNLRMADNDIAEVVQYLQEETDRQQPVTHMAGDDMHAGHEGYAGHEGHHMQ